MPLLITFPLFSVMSIAVGMPSGYFASYSGPPWENLGKGLAKTSNLKPKKLKTGYNMPYMPSYAFKSPYFNLICL